MRNYIRAASVAAFVLFAGSATAATVFEDTFNRSNSNTVGNGWSELENDGNDVRIYSSSYLHLRDYLGGNPDAAASSMVIDATGYENLTIDFRWRSFSSNEGNDDLYLSWALDPAPAMTNENAWTQLYNGSDGGTSWHTRSRSLAGGDNSMFNIMFWSDVGNSNEGFLVDYVRVSGDAISAVPLPATGLLLIAGLGGFGALRRKKKS